jgi:hypothetical protein
MSNNSIRVQLTFHLGEAVYPQLFDLLDSPVALRRRLHALIHIGVRADEFLPQQRLQPLEQNDEGLSVAAMPKTHAAKAKSSQSDNDKPVPYVVPKLDLEGLPG